MGCTTESTPGPPTLREEQKTPRLRQVREGYIIESTPGSSKSPMLREEQA
jgi:hypothetical protein